MRTMTLWGIFLPVLGTNPFFVEHIAEFVGRIVARQVQPESLLQNAPALGSRLMIFLGLCPSPLSPIATLT